MLAKEISKRIDDWLEQYTVQVDEETRTCKRCGDTIWGRGKRLSVHEHYTTFKGMHGGGGRVEEIVFPYCRKCDGNIDHFKDITCIDF